MTAAPPQAFGRYRVTSTLGAGAMGDVYLAVDDVLGREVAIKTLRASGIAAGGLGARILDERFRHEARAIAQLAHPAIVQVFDLDPAADPPYLVMERVSGPSLKERLAQGPLTIADARAMGIQVANALATAHAAGIVHRDVKPANILIAGPSSWKLADFGVAHVPDSSLTISGQFMGSPAYAPPEALLKGVVSPASDIFGLGATLYQAIAGTWPRLDASTSGLLAPVPPLRDLAPDVPIELAAAIDRAVAMEAADRPAASELAHALASRPSLEMLGAATPPTGIPATPIPGAMSMPGVMTPVPGSMTASTATPVLTDPEQQRSRRRLLAIGGVILALLVIIAVVASRGGSSGRSNAAALPSPFDRAEDRDEDDDEREESPGKAEDEFRKVNDKVRERKYGEALRKLDDWQRRFDPQRVDPNANDLRAQLEALPADWMAPGPPGRGKHGKKH